LKRELETYGNPPQFPAEEPEEEKPKQVEVKQVKEDPSAFHATKSKAKSKTGTLFKNPNRLFPRRWEIPMAHYEKYGRPGSRNS
jgi:hypothetical protein